MTVDRGGNGAEKEVQGWIVGASLLIAAVAVAFGSVSRWALVMTLAGSGFWVVFQIIVVRIDRHLDRVRNGRNA